MMHLSPHDCDLLSAGLTPPEEAARLREHAAGCPDCAARLADSDASRAAFLVQNPPATRARQLVDEMGRPRRRWIWALGGLVPAAAAIVFLLLPQNGIRLKGASLSCRVTRGTEVVAVVTAGQSVDGQTGDTLRCTVDGKGRLDVWGDGQKIYGADLSGPTELPTAFAVSGKGAQRLYFSWNGEPPGPTTPFVEVKVP